MVEKLPPNLLDYLRREAIYRRSNFLEDEDMRDVLAFSMSDDEFNEMLKLYKDELVKLGIERKGSDYAILKNKDIVNMLDPSYYSVRDLYRQLRDKLLNLKFDDGDWHKKFLDGDLTSFKWQLKHVTPELLSSIISNDNTYDRYNELRSFMHDYGRYLHEDEPIRSRKHYTKLKEQFEEQERIEAENKEIDYYILKNKQQEFSDAMINALIDSSGEPIRGEEGSKFKEAAKQALRNKYREEALAFTNRPYEYPQGLQDIVQKHGWELFKDLNHQTEVGCRLGHCYGDVKRYGPNQREYYKNLIRGGNSVLVNKGPVTAQIDFKDIPNSQRRKATLGQVMRPYDEQLKMQPAVNPNEPDYPHDLIKEVDRIISDYNAKSTVSDMNTKILKNSKYKNEINKLIKLAEGYKGYPNIKELLEAEALIDGYDSDIVTKVLEKLNNTEQSSKGGALGVAHNPNKQWRNLVSLVRRY